MNQTDSYTLRNMEVKKNTSHSLLVMKEKMIVVKILRLRLFLHVGIVSKPRDKVYGSLT